MHLLLMKLLLQNRISSVSQMAAMGSQINYILNGVGSIKNWRGFK